MAPSAIEQSSYHPPEQGDRLESIRRMSRAVRPRLSHARELAALTALAVSAPTNARSRTNALRSAQEMAQRHRLRPDIDPDHLDVPQGASAPGRSS